MKKVVITISAIVLLSLLFKKKKATLPGPIQTPLSPQQPVSNVPIQTVPGNLIGKQLEIIAPTLVYNNAIGLNVTVTPGEPIGTALKFDLQRNEYLTTIPRYGGAQVWINATKVKAV